MTKNAKAEPGKYLTFELDDQHYGVPISAVREINQMLDITPVPQTPQHMAGVINLRGKIVPVADLRQRLGLVPASRDRQTCIVVLESTVGYMGVIVDAVSDVADLTTDMIEETPKFGDATKMEFVTGMGKTEQRVIILIDTNVLLANDVLKAMEKNASALISAAA